MRLLWLTVNTLQILVGVGALSGGIVMWYRSRHAGWALLLVLFGLQSGLGWMWWATLGRFYLTTITMLMNQHSSPTAVLHFTHMIHMWQILFSIPTLLGLLYGLYLLRDDLRRGWQLRFRVAR